MNKRYNWELIENEPERKSFKTTCDCNDTDHDIWTEVEYNKENKDLTLSFFVQVMPSKMYEYFTENKIKKYWNRLKFCWSVLRGKPITLETSFIFRGRNHIEDFCNFIYLLGKDCNKETNELIETKKELHKLKNRR